MKKYIPLPGPLNLRALLFPEPLRLLVLGPHPDDFDVIAVAMRWFIQEGHFVRAVVATSGASGVEEDFCDPPTWENKSNTRDAEQRAAFNFFGFDKFEYEFWRMPEDEEGHPIDSPENADRIRDMMYRYMPHFVFLPHGNDTNRGHQRIYAMFDRMAEFLKSDLVAWLVRDPKSIDIRTDVFMPFDGDDAEWKAMMLRCHRSQHQRNLNTRKHGIDERILAVNRRLAEELKIDEPFAEGFELEFREDGRIV